MLLFQEMLNSCSVKSESEIKFYLFSYFSFRKRVQVFFTIKIILTFTFFTQKIIDP